ncbi:MAG: helix-turn-helix transcriptional regulator [Clostridiaceae bacterium]|nr:helix-turn-helix transcriptional regulator [Clostridiaceae bacterium]
MIGYKIKALRQEKGLTQRELAKAINYSNSYIGDLESERTNPSIKTLERIAQYFSIEINYFFDIKCCHQKQLNNETHFCYCNIEGIAEKCPLNKKK